jgi:hypothetical protein
MAAALAFLATDNQKGSNRGRAARGAGLRAGSIGLSGRCR